MGIDYDSKLIYGWEIDIKALYNWAIKKGIGYSKCKCKEIDIKDNWIEIKNNIIKKTKKFNPETCCCMYIDCWDIDFGDNSVSDFKLIESSNYYDCGPLDSSYHITLLKNTISTSYTPKTITLDTLIEARKNASNAYKLVKEINDLYKELNTTIMEYDKYKYEITEEPTVYSTVHIW